MADVGLDAGWNQRAKLYTDGSVIMQFLGINRFYTFDAGQSADEETARIGGHDVAADGDKAILNADLDCVTVVSKRWVGSKQMINVIENGSIITLADINGFGHKL